VSDIIHAVINISPVAQKRARSRAIKTKTGKYIATTYKDSEQRRQEHNLRTVLYEYRPPIPLDCPISIRIDAYLPCPSSFSHKKQIAAFEGSILPAKKPDLDNLIKHMLDCMKGVFYNDDKQIVHIDARKYYGFPPRWEFWISEEK